MVAIEQARLRLRSLRLSMLIRLEPAGSRAIHPQRHSGVSSMHLSRTDIRKQIRLQRQALSSSQQRSASSLILEQLASLTSLGNAEHIALYLSVDGELDTYPLIEYFWSQGKSVYLPIIHPFSKGHLIFQRYTPTTEMTQNRYSIAEPVLNVTQLLPVAQLDIIFTPLVAFDNKGHRLGMGGGYYDRSLANWFETGQGPHPIGLAHKCQQVAEIPNEAWDIPLPTIITPDKIWHWEFPVLSL